MRSCFVALLVVWVGLLARAAGLLAADCDSTPEDLLLLEDAQYSADSIREDQPVVLEGVMKYFFSPQNFMIQSTDGEFQVSVMSPTPVRIMAQEGERVRVAGIMLPTGGPPTLMLPMGPEVETSVALCSQRAHVRQLTKDNGHTWGGGESGSVGASSMPCFYR